MFIRLLKIARLIVAFFILQAVFGIAIFGVFAIGSEHNKNSLRKVIIQVVVLLLVFAAIQVSLAKASPSYAPVNTASGFRALSKGAAIAALAGIVVLLVLVFIVLSTVWG